MDYFELINLLSDSTLEIIKLDLDRQYQDLLSNIEDKESTIEAHRNSGEPWTVSIAEMESLVRVHWFQLESIARHVDRIEESQLKRGLV
jgi:hypothetical protein|tara:strand:+ start:578 stop:844 length:267 start_codon:yes stop_codon:yes gene_type:complete